MTQPDDSRKKLIMVVSTGAVTLVLALIVLFAVLAPPSPEGVVSEMLTCFARQDIEGLETLVADSALAELQAAAVDQSSSRWRVLWDNGNQLFKEYKIGEVKVSGNEAVVVVYYGPGLIQEEEFVLRRENRRWKVYNLYDIRG